MDMKITRNTLINWSEKGNKIAIFCAGQIGVATYEILKKCGVEVYCFFDNDKKKFDKEIIDGCFCRNAELIKDKDKYIIFIGILDHYYDEVEEKVKNRGFANIANFIELFDDIIVNYPYLYMDLITWFQNYPLLEVFYVKNPNRNSEAFKYNVLEKKRIAVYTSVFGEYDNISRIKIKPDNIDYYLVSDDEKGKINGYIWIDAKKLFPIVLHRQ